MKTKLIISTILFLVLAACASTAESSQVSQEDSLSTALANVNNTQTMLAQTSVAQATNTTTPEPPTATAIRGADGREYAWNYLSTIESGGVSVTIARVLLAEKEVLPIDIKTGLGQRNIFLDKPVIGQIVFVVENKNDFIASVYPDQAKVLVESEQIDLFEYAIASADFGNFSGDILPKARLVGGIWFGIQRTAHKDINSMTIYFPAPVDQNFNSLGPDFNFVLDLTEKKFEPVPEELK